MDGWISIYRQITEHWTWKEKPFSKGQAWIDILLLVNHKDEKFPLGRELVECCRGEKITSEPALAERWGWSRTKVRNFLEMLEKDNMIINKKEGRKRTRIKVLNYSDYQDFENNRKTTEKQEKNNKKTSEEQPENINNNDNKLINNKGAALDYFCQKVGKLVPSSKDIQEVERVLTIPDVRLDDITWAIDEGLRRFANSHKEGKVNGFGYFVSLVQERVKQRVPSSPRKAPNDSTAGKEILEIFGYQVEFNPATGSYTYGGTTYLSEDACRQSLEMRAFQEGRIAHG